MTVRLNRLPRTLLALLPAPLLTWVKKQPQRLVLPLLALAILLLIWQVLCASPQAPLPSPLTVLGETWDLIVDPFLTMAARIRGYSGKSWRVCSGLPWVILWRRSWALVWGF